MLEKAISTLSLLALAWLVPCGPSLEARAQEAAPSPQAADHLSAQAIPPQASADEIMSGIQLYNQSDDKGALEIFRRVVKKRGNEIAAWHYMGLIYARMGKTEDARKAHEKAALSGEWLLEKFYSSTFPDVPSAAARYKPLLLLAADSAKKYLELTSKPSRSKVEEWNYRAEMLRDYVEVMQEPATNPAAIKIFMPGDVEVKARFISRPNPGYTTEATKNMVTGTVVLRAILAFDGRVRNIRVIKGLPDGLSFQAVEAARRIKFIPSTINGQPVSMHIQIEYNFKLY